ncbi:MAG: enoyl-CoA hydratase [Anaerolineae bacterium]
MSSPFIQFHTQDGIAHIRLNRPDVLNALTRDMLRGISAALDEAANDASIRAIILSGAGRAFCAGDDLAEAAQLFDKNISLRQTREHLEEFQAITRKILSIPKPVIAAIQGAAVGAGAEIAIACDLRIASEDAYFMFAEAKRGLFQTNGVMYLLPRMIGHARAAHLMMSADKLKAEPAREMGLVTQVCRADELMPAAQNMAQKLSKNSPLSLKLIKQTLLRSHDLDLEAVMQMEVDGMMTCLLSEDLREGVQAFVEKREPNFTGK